MTFQQDYNGAELCHTAAMQYGKLADFDEDLFLRKIDRHQIEHPSGLWTVENHRLHFQSNYGVVFLTFEIEKVTSDTVVLTNEGNRIFLRKKTF